METADGQSLGPLQVETPRDALRATMMMLFQHVAEIHMAVTEIISEKYNIPQEEIYNAITEHPKWQEMLVNPMIHDLTGEILDKTSETASQVSTEEPKKKRGRPKGYKLSEEQRAKAAEARAAKKAASTQNTVATPPPRPAPEPQAEPKETKPKKKRAIKIVESLEEFKQLQEASP